jgi:hypothetical protein
VSCDSTSVLASGLPWASTTVTVTGCVMVTDDVVQPGTVQATGPMKEKPMPAPGTTKWYVAGTSEIVAWPVASVSSPLSRAPAVVSASTSVPICATPSVSTTLTTTGVVTVIDADVQAGVVHDPAAPEKK